VGAAGDKPLGAYLTDGHRLLKVAGVSEDKKLLLLEDCGDDCDRSAVFWMPVREVRAAKGWRRVVPAEGAVLSLT
jgi:hypothetical protein